MSQILAVWSENKLVGEIAILQGRWSFTYNKDWCESNVSFVLSPYFPFQLDTYSDTVNDKRVEWFFENLLPEGDMRAALARQARLTNKDSFGLLSRYGEETAGALTLLSIDVPYPTHSFYRELPHNELRARIANTANSSLLASSENLHMSLAGVQNKLAVLYEDNKFSLPEGTGASSHILKPDNNNTNFKFCPANEFFCMRLAREFGLKTPETKLLHIPEALYLINRYDRTLIEKTIKRKHQIDLCQMLNKWVGYKYESHGGITMQDMFNAITKVTQPIVAKQQVIRWIIFNYLIGNSDAHAKNISFILSSNNISIAPFYDLLCVQAYLPNSELAMSIDGESKPGWIEEKHWINLASTAGIMTRLLKEYLKDQTDNIVLAARKLLTLPEFTAEEIDFLDKTVINIIQQRVEFVIK
ncbi:MAG: HipA domain-containing protein [Thiohalomonadales bacterium]